MKNWKICIPTYKRKKPLSLMLLDRDEKIELNYFVREEELESGFYDALQKIDRVNVISLGRGLHELGETRERIMQYCRQENVDYCVMLDDGVFNLDYTRCDLSISELFRRIENRIEKDKEKDRIVGFSLVKAVAKTLAYEKFVNIYPYACLSTQIDYLANVPTQAVILNVKQCEKYDLHYKSLDEVGFEDCAFFVDALKKGCLFASNIAYTFSAIVPNAKKEGGSHEHTTSLELKYDTQMLRCRKYIGDIYGISIQKRYRKYADSQLMMIEIDCKYFREVLTDLEHNQKIVDNQFKIE